ncbi:MAG: hypothetical protein LBB34_02500 [Holosporales bacterium]|nr:hypothetical protein [Holosporales bacterium]
MTSESTSTTNQLLNIADANGQIVASFTIPEGVPVGTKLVQFFGDQGSYGEATYTGKNTVTIEERRKVTTVTLSSQQVTTVVLNRYDPLAQTFTLQESRHIGGIDLWFENKGMKRVVVQIRDTNLGLPNQTILAEGSIMPASINVNGTTTRIAWTSVFLERNHEYAIVVLTDCRGYTATLTRRSTTSSTNLQRVCERICGPSIAILPVRIWRMFRSP